MKIFVTGATGWVGSAVVAELKSAGHQVLGLARSDAAAALLVAAGAEVQRGDLNDLESLRTGAAASDGVIHTGFIHNFAYMAASFETDRCAIETLGAVLAGSDRPLIVTSGTAGVSPGRPATEDDPMPLNPMWPRVSERTATALLEQGVRAAVVRLSPSVHGDGDHGFVPILINTAREKGASAYVGNGSNRWTAVHRLDAGHLYRLAVEKHFAPGARFHGVADEGIAFKDIAQVIGDCLNLPVVSKSAEEAAEHFGWFATFAGLDIPASNALTQEQLAWHPRQPGLLLDLKQSTRYFAT